MTLSFRITSDWHLEHYREYKIPCSPRDANEFMFLKQTEKDKDQILLLGGDVVGKLLENNVDTIIIEKLSKRFKHIYMIMGNHEHYGGIIENTRNHIEDRLSHIKNFTLLENDFVFLNDDTVLFGTTLWTNFHSYNRFYMNYSQFGMNDYRYIFKGDGKQVITPDDIADIHRKSYHELYEFCKLPQKNKIIMTHHLPSFKSVAREYKNSPLNHAFASDLDNLIFQTKPKYWIHGHTHHNFDYYLGKTRIICNPYGYRNENEKYNDNLVIEINE